MQCPTGYTVLQTNNSVRNFSAVNPCHFRKSSGKPFCAIANQHLALSVRKKGGHRDACFVAAAFGKKACIGIK